MLKNEIFSRKAERLNTIHLPPEISWHCPEGTFAGTFREVKYITDRKTKKPLIRLIFNIVVPWQPDTQFLAANNYEDSEKPSAQLIQDLKSWLGGNQTIELPKLTGRAGEFVIQHLSNPGYSKPYVSIQSMHPAGTQLLTRQPLSNN